MTGALGGRLCCSTGGYSWMSSCSTHLTKVPRIGDVANRNIFLSSTDCQVQGQDTCQLCRWQPCYVVCGGIGRRNNHVIYQFRTPLSVGFHDLLMIQRPRPHLPSHWKLGDQNICMERILFKRKRMPVA